VADRSRVPVLRRSYCGGPMTSRLRRLINNLQSPQIILV
jgi:hypothetical protein